MKRGTKIHGYRMQIKLQANSTFKTNKKKKKTSTVWKQKALSKKKKLFSPTIKNKKKFQS